MFVQYYDPEDDSTGTGEGDVHAVVTEGVMQAAIQAAVVTAVAELKDGIAELKDGMKQDRDRAAEALVGGSQLARWFAPHPLPAAGLSPLAPMASPQPPRCPPPCAS